MRLTLVTRNEVRPETTMLTSWEQQALKKWRDRMTKMPKHLRMLPSPYRNGTIPISEQEACASEAGTDRWMSQYKLEEVEDYAQNNSFNPLAKEVQEYCVEIGLGNGRGYGYVKTAMENGLFVQLFDWLDESIEETRQVLSKLLAVPPYGYPLKYMLLKGEARRLLLGDKTGGGKLNHDQIRIGIASTLFEHIGFCVKPAAKRKHVQAQTIQGMGQILRQPKNRVIVINTPPEGNEHVAREGSAALEDSFILEHLAIGAGAKVRVTRESVHQSQTSRFSGYTVRKDEW